jgi:methyltransferase family protein
MIEVSSCVICEGAIRELKRALVAPFVANRTWNRTPFCVDLVECEACGFMFYNPRLEDEDLRRLYGSYRSEEYQKMRFDSEPWYTKKFNEDLASPGSYELRRAKLSPILKEHLGPRKIGRILDYGGDRGDLVAGLLEGAEAYCFDISGIEAAPGVTGTNDPASCKADLIINSNVLEHVGFPRVLVNEILQAAPEGCLIFLEVPCEAALGFKRIVRRVAQIGIMTLTRPSLARHIVRPASLFMMHEHINYFTEHCLTTLVHVCGAEVVASGSYPLDSTAGNESVGWCLAQKSSSILSGFAQ